MREEPFLGGNLNQAVRVGDTVRRRAGLWTPAVHALLRYLENAGFEAPRVQGIDERGRETLGFVNGTNYWESKDPLPDPAFDEEHVVDAARLLRRYHDIVAGFSPPADAHWRLTAPTEHELICHNDWSPWNALFRDGRLAVLLDWDLAGPGSRLWDVANASYSWVPLISEVRLFSLPERAHRLRLFCDAYGLDDRSQLLPTMRLRINYVARFIEAQARSGDPGFVQLVAWNTPAKMVNDIAYMERNWSTFERALA